MMTLSSQSARPQLLRAASVVMVFFVASRVLGLVRDIVISHQFGTARELDAYFAAFTMTDLIFNVVAGGALGSAFIPVFSSAIAGNQLARAWRLASSVINVAFAVLAITAVLAAVFAPQLVSTVVAPSFAADDQMLTATLLRWMLIAPVVFGVSGVVMGILNSFQNFVLPALAPVLYNLSIIVAAILLAPSMGVYGLAAGVVAGAVLHLLVQIPWLVRKGMPYTLDFGLDNPDVRQVGRLMLPRTIGLAAVQINFLVNTIIASALPAGRIAALGYAWRVMLLPEGIIALSLATAVFPTLSQQQARREHAAFSRTFATAFRTTLYLTIPAAAGLIMLGKPLVTVLFQRGEFDASSTLETSLALQFFAIGLFAHSGLEIVTRAFYALHDTKTPVLFGVGAVLLNIALSITLVAPLSHGGLALANSIATILEMLFLLVILLKRLGGADVSRIVGSVIRSGIGAASMALILYLLVSLVNLNESAVVAAIGVLAGAVSYAVVTALIGSEETRELYRRLKQMLPAG